MTDYQTSPQDVDAPIRDRTIPIGTDTRGYDYLLKTEACPDRVVVVDGGERLLVDDLHDLRPRDVVATVADRVGWRTCRFAEIGAKPVPRKHA